MKLFRRGAQDRPAPAVTLLTKPGCHLCHKARAVVAKVTADLGAELTERNILDDEQLNARYWDKIPVVLVGGEVHAVYHVDEPALRAALGAG